MSDVYRSFTHSNLSTEEKNFWHFPLMWLHKSLEIWIKVEQEERVYSDQPRDQVNHHQLHLAIMIKGIIELKI